MKTYDSVAQMKLSFLQSSQLVETKGYYNPNDGGHATYLIEANQAVDNFGNHDLAGTTVAILQPSEVFVEAFGARGDGNVTTLQGTNDVAAIQAAYDSVPNNGGAIGFRDKNYLISEPLIFKRIVNVKGNPGVLGSVIFADTAMTTLIELPQVTGDNNLVLNASFTNLDLKASDLANYCINGFGTHLLFRDMRFRESVIAGTDVSFGWDINWDNCYWLNNLLDGMVMSQHQNNQNTFQACKFVRSGRLGARVNGSYANKFNNCLFEENAGAGIMFDDIRAASLDTCYFEKNAFTGMVFSTPAVTVKADVIVNGTAVIDEMAVAFPAKGLTVNNSFVSAVNIESHIYAISAEGLTADNCVLNPGFSIPLIKAYGSLTSSSTFFRCPNMQIGPAPGFPKLLEVDNSVSSFRGDEGFIFDTVQPVNIGEADLNAWTLRFAGTSASWQRSAVVYPSGPNTPVWELVLAATSTSERYGFGIEASDYPELEGKLMVFSVDMKAAETDTPTITLSANGGTRTFSETEWTNQSLFFNMPASGAVNCDVKKGIAVGDAVFANPVLAEIGSNINLLARSIPIVAAEFREGDTLIPIAGTWKVADKVLANAPAAGGTIGVVNTTAGTPGTWKTYGTIEA